MHSKLAILAIFVVVVCGRNRRGGGGGSDEPAFLQGVSQSARRQFFEIVNDVNLTQNQIANQTEAWATTNNVTASYNAFQANLTALEAQAEQNLTAAVGNLPSVLTKVNAIFNNKDLTGIQTGQAIEDLAQTYPLEVEMLLL